MATTMFRNPSKFFTLATLFTVGATASAFTVADIASAKLASLLPVHDVAVVRGESVEHEAIAVIGFLKDSNAVTDIAFDQIESSALDGEPTFDAIEGIELVVTDVTYEPPPEGADPTVALVIRGQLEIETNDDTSDGMKTFRINLPALSRWAKDQGYELSTDPIFTIRAMVYANKLEKEMGDVPADPAAAIELEAAKIQERNSNVMFNGTMLWVFGAAFTIIAAAIGWFFAKRFFSYT